MALKVACFGHARRWFTRYAGWGPGQLARECASGVWFTAAASAPLLLQQDPGVARTDSGRAMWHQARPPCFPCFHPCVTARQEEEKSCYQLAVVHLARCTLLCMDSSASVPSIKEHWCRESCLGFLQVLELMGGEHAGLSQEAKGLYDPTIMGAPAPPDSTTGDSSGGSSEHSP